MTSQNVYEAGDDDWHFSKCPIMWAVAIVGSDAGSLEVAGIVLVGWLDGGQSWKKVFGKKNLWTELENFADFSTSMYRNLTFLTQSCKKRIN